MPTKQKFSPKKRIATKSLGISALRKLAEQGKTEAQFWLGVKLSSKNKQAMSKERIESNEWFKKAAEQEHESAAHNLGFAYSVGAGCKADAQTAIDWYLKSHEWGNKSGIWLATEILLDGTLMKPDGRRAIELLKIDAAIPRVHHLSSTAVSVIASSAAVPVTLP